jgi:hypothetical protein
MGNIPVLQKKKSRPKAALAGFGANEWPNNAQASRSQDNAPVARRRTQFSASHFAIYRGRGGSARMILSPRKAARACGARSVTSPQNVVAGAMHGR